MDTTENVQMSEATKTAVRGAKVASSMYCKGQSCLTSGNLISPLSQFTTR